MSWSQKPLEEVANFSLGKMLDQKKNRGALMPYLANVNVRWGEFNFENLREMRFEQGELDRYGLKYGDIVMCEGGEPGRCAIWKDQVPGMMIQKALHRIRPHPCLDSRFLFYSFLKKGRNDGLSGLFTGSTIKHLPREKLAKVRIDIPPLPIQQRLADILSGYDDLIENNRRRIALLEEAARLLCREWFVHFRFPGHEHVKIIDGLPEGWERARVADKFDTTSGGTPSRSKPGFFSGNINWVKTQELNERPIFETAEKITEEAIARSSAKLLPAQTLLVSIYGNTNIGRTGLLVFPGSSNQACVALFPKRRKEDWIYAQLWIQQHREQIVGLAQGAAQTNISQKTLRGLVMIWPTSLLLDTFLDSVLSSYQQIECLCLQNSKLSQARDLLLPRLMNGEIAV